MPESCGRFGLSRSQGAISSAVFRLRLSSTAKLSVRQLQSRGHDNVIWDPREQAKSKKTLQFYGLWQLTFYLLSIFIHTMLFLSQALIPKSRFRSQVPRYFSHSTGKFSYGLASGQNYQAVVCCRKNGCMKTTKHEHTNLVVVIQHCYTTSSFLCRTTLIRSSSSIVAFLVHQRMR